MPRVRRWPVSGLRRRRDHGLGGLPPQPVHGARRTSVTTTGAATPRAGCGSARRSRRVRPASGPTARRLPSLLDADLVPGGLTADEVAAERGRRDRRRGHHQPGHRLARGARADDAATVPRAASPGPGALKEAVRGPGNRVQPHQHARGGRRDPGAGDADLVSMARPMLADPEFANKAAPGGRRDQRMHRLQPGVPRSDLLQAGGDLPCQSQGRPRDRIRRPRACKGQAHRRRGRRASWPRMRRTPRPSAGTP